MLTQLQTRFNEDGCRKLFDQYHADKSVFALSKGDLRRFLFDLMEAQGLKAIVPDEALTAVLRTLILNYNASKDSVTWIEWKSFFVYLQNTPLEVLLSKVTAPYTPQDLKNARYYVLESKNSGLIPDVSELSTIVNEGREERPLYLALDFADFRVYICQPGVIIEGKELSLGENILDRFQVSKEELTHFPPDVNRQVGIEHQALSHIASTWCKASNFMAGKTQEINDWDKNNLKVKDSVKSTWKLAKTTWSSSGIAGFLSTTAAKVNSMATEVDETLRISDKVKKVKEDAAAGVNTAKETLLSNSTLAAAVDKGMSTSENIMKEMKRKINKEKYEKSPRAPGN